MSGSNAVSKTVSTLQSAYNLTKSIADLNEVHAVKAQILSAQESSLRSQEREAALTRQVHELEQHIAQLETWNAEKQRYQLTDFGGNTFAYLLKADMSEGEPEHRLCANCFQKCQRSILQFLHKSQGQETYQCPNCDHIFHFGVYTS